MLNWMAWTPVTAGFFVAIAALLMLMGLAEIVWPSTGRKGILPIDTTRGDRLFIGLLTSAYIHLAWLSFTDAALYLATLCCVVWVGLLLRWA